MTLSSIFSLLSKINLTNLSKNFKAIMVVNFKMHMSTLFSPNMVFSCATPIPIAPPKRPCLTYASHHRQHGSHSSLSISSHLINILPTKSLDDLTPHEVLFCVSPTYSHLHIFGCLCYPNVAATAPYMFAPRATPCIFLGYQTLQKGFCCLDPTSGRLIISRHVTFDESQSPFSSSAPTPPPTSSSSDDLIHLSIITHLPSLLPTRMLPLSLPNSPPVPHSSTLSRLLLSIPVATFP